MKIIKRILLLLLVLVVGFLIYAAIQPSSYEISRTKTLKAPVEVVYNNVSDFKNWEEWLPWKEQDPTMKINYDAQTKGVGASYSWESEQGPGSMKMVETVPNESIANELDFGEMGSSKSTWKFNPVDGGTEVTWGMKAEESPFIMKIFSAMSGGWDNMMGPMFERGLEKLDSVTQIQAEAYKAAMNEWSLGEVTKKPLEAQTFIGFPHAANMNDHEGIQKIYMESLPKVGTYASESGLKYEEYTPGAIFTKTDMASGDMEFLVGVFLKKALTPSEGMETVSMPAGDVVMVPKYGNYGTGDMEAHVAIEKFMTENKLSVNGHIYEMYVNDPTTVKPNEIQTDIYYPVK